jgi:hypothetical protein
MITKKAQAELIKLGARFPGSRLVQQGAYLLSIAGADGGALLGYLPPGFRAELTQVRDDVDKARQDKTNTLVDAKQATGTQHEIMEDAIRWLGTVANRAKRTLRAGANVPEELTTVGKLQSVPAVLEAASKALGLLNEHAAEFDSIGPAVKPLIDEGQQLYQALDKAEATQEQARLSDLPASVTAYYAKKGELYIGLKILIDAGHELHSRDHQAAARYNLSLLNRRRGHSAPEPTPPTPTPSATKT